MYFTQQNHALNVSRPTKQIHALDLDRLIPQLFQHSTVPSSSSVIAGNHNYPVRGHFCHVLQCIPSAALSCRVRYYHIWSLATAVKYLCYLFCVTSYKFRICDIVFCGISFCIVYCRLYYLNTYELFHLLAH